MIELTIISPEKTETLELKDAAITIGRSSDNAINISDAKASRKHCRIEKVDNTYILTESVNGTLLNSKNVISSHLKEGDEILIGSTLILISEIYIPQAPKVEPPPKPIVIERNKAIGLVKSYAPIVLAIIVVIVAINIISGMISPTKYKESQNTHITEIKEKLEEIRTEIASSANINKSFTERVLTLRNEIESIEIESIEDTKDKRKTNNFIQYLR